MTTQEIRQDIELDFTTGRLGYRCHPKRVRHEPLAKAVGLKATYCPTIIDTTAGLGTDAFILASLGCQVLCLEREPKVATVLHTALSKARETKSLADIANRIQLLTIEAKDYLTNLAPSDYPDVVYCDPMFAPRTKSAKVKKNMQWLQQTVPLTQDAEQLAKIAFRLAKRRLVIKREKSAPNLLDNPTFRLEGRQCRFDVYVTQGST